MSSRHSIVAFLGGLVFALGLGISGMMQPARIIGFLDLFGAWDPTLAFVMFSAVPVYALMYRLALRRGQPMFAPRLLLPTRSDLDRRLIAGAVLFGAGWGLSGFCPGPAISSLVSGNTTVVVFVAAMTAGMLLHGLWEAALVRRHLAATGSAH